MNDASTSDASQHFDRRYILKLSCPDQRGIVAAVASFLAEQDCNILESAQFDDEMSGQFFMRTVFGAGAATPTIENISAAFGPIASRFAMECSIHDLQVKPKALILVSKPGHCLNDLLYRTSSGSLGLDVVGIVSNHPDQQPLAEFYNLDYHHLPVTPETKADQETKIRALIDGTGADLIVLARYMQILTPEMCAFLS
ncbi:MAG: formyltetrahydrofolate deformylase, partial [Rhodospirillaceae bacterium]|nr:formyltetrahydrofolate deformylase [Rhodospirillaceae bacterium]